jgi:hypothetical protein
MRETSREKSNPKRDGDKIRKPERDIEDGLGDLRAMAGNGPKGVIIIITIIIIIYYYIIIIIIIIIIITTIASELKT